MVFDCDMLGIYPCIGCREQYFRGGSICLVYSYYTRLFDSNNPKSIILEALNYNNGFYLYAAIKKHYPQYKELYDKLVILR